MCFFFVLNWYPTSTNSHWGPVTQFPTDIPSKTVSRRGSDTRVNIWLMHDTAPSHFVFAVWEYLNVFLEQSIRKGGPKVWPAPSHDLNHLDFYVWGHSKSTLYVPEVRDVQELQQQIQNGVEMISMTPAIQAITVQT
jgi:hypothetical protein